MNNQHLINIIILGSGENVFAYEKKVGIAGFEAGYPVLFSGILQNLISAYHISIFVSKVP